MTLEFRMPKLGESVTEGTIGRWLKRPGDRVEQYEPMLEVTTDKVDTEVSAPVDGVLAAILVGEGETVGVGTVIAQLEPAGSGNHAVTNAVEEPAAEAVAAAGEAAEGRFVSPVVARLVARHGLEINAIPGTGAGGRVTRRDVEAFVARRDEQAAAATTPAEPTLPDAAPAGGRSRRRAPNKPSCNRPSKSVHTVIRSRRFLRPPSSARRPPPWKPTPRSCRCRRCAARLPNTCCAQSKRHRT